MKWSNYWRDIAENGKLPCHFFLFEDLKDQPQTVLDGVLRFLLDGREIKGTYLEERLNKATSDSKAAVLYKPRTGKSAHDVSKFTKEQLARFDTLLADNPYFYRMSDPTTNHCHWPAEEKIEGKDNFTTLNEKIIARISDPSYKKQELTMNAPGTGYKMDHMEPAYFAKVQLVQLDSHIKEPIE